MRRMDHAYADAELARGAAVATPAGDATAAKRRFTWSRPHPNARVALLGGA